jgi:hypothetical protein
MPTFLEANSVRRVEWPISSKKLTKSSRLEAPTPPAWWLDQFYDIVEENVKADLLDGKIIRDSPSVPKHALIVTWVGRLAGDYAEAFNLGIVVGANTTVRLTQYQGPEPDVLFIRKSRIRIMGEKYIDGPPDLCVEVISKPAANAIVAASSCSMPITASKSIGSSTPSASRSSFTKIRMANGWKSSRTNMDGYIQKSCPVFG